MVCLLLCSFSHSQSIPQPLHSIFLSKWWASLNLSGFVVKNYYVFKTISELNVHKITNAWQNSAKPIVLPLATPNFCFFALPFPFWHSLPVEALNLGSYSNTSEHYFGSQMCMMNYSIHYSKLNIHWNCAVEQVKHFKLDFYLNLFLNMTVQKLCETSKARSSSLIHDGSLWVYFWENTLLCYDMRDWLVKPDV